MERPAGTPEQSAETLAKLVLEGGPNSLAALERAALESGFAIFDLDGKYVHVPAADVDLGLAISQIELALILELMKRQETYRLETFGTVYAGDEKLKAMNLPSLIVTSLANFAGTAHPGKRFSSNFVRNLGFHSDGLYSALSTDFPGAEMSAVQFSWITLITAGQVHAGTQPVPAPTPPPLAQLLVSIDPLSGIVPVAQRSMSSMRASMQIIRSMNQSQVANYVRQQAGQGTSPELALLNLSWAHIYRVGLRMRGSMDNPPLVRTKKKGQKGEDRNIHIYLTFNISDRMRRQFAQVWQMGSGGIHRNGPIGTHWELNGAIDGDKVHIANVPQWQTQMRPGEYIIQARGNEQTEDFSQDAIAVNTMEHWAFWVKPRELAPLVNDAIAKSFRIPVRDWRQPGIALTYTLMTHGSGVEPLPDGGSMKWTINRSVNGTSRLTQELPMPMLPSRGNPQSRATGPTPGRFISWMADPTQPSRLPNAIIEDEFVWKRKAEKECGEEPIDPNIEYSETTKDLPHPSATSPMSFGFYQFDKTDKTASLNVFANSQPPVEIRRLNTPVQRTQMSVFQDITFDANPSTPHLQLPDKVIDFPLTAGTGASGLPGYRQVRIPLSGTATTKKHGITGTANLRVSGEIMIYIPATGGPRPNLATVQRATRYALAMLAQNGSGAKPRH